MHSASCRDQVSFRIATENGHFVAPTTCASHHTGVPGPSAAYSSGNTYPALMPLFEDDRLEESPRETDLIDSKVPPYQWGILTSRIHHKNSPHATL